MQLSDFDYELPPELIAQEPLEVRSASRMLVVNKTKRTIEDRMFSDLPGILGRGDVLVHHRVARAIGVKYHRGHFFLVGRDEPQFIRPALRRRHQVVYRHEPLLFIFIP